MPWCKHMYPNALTGFTAVEAVFAWKHNGHLMDSDFLKCYARLIRPNYQIYIGVDGNFWRVKSEQLFYIIIIIYYRI